MGHRGFRAHGEAFVPTGSPLELTRISCQPIPSTASTVAHRFYGKLIVNLPWTKIVGLAQVQSSLSISLRRAFLFPCLLLWRCPLSFTPLRITLGHSRFCFRAHRELPVVYHM